MSSYTAVFVNDTSNRNNWGCQSTSLGARRVIERALRDRDNARLVCLEHLDPKSTDNYLGHSSIDRIRNILAHEGCLCRNDESFILKFSRKMCGVYVDEIAAADVVFYQAEGALTGRSFAEGERLLLLPFLAKVIFKKQVIAFNQTLYSSSASFSRMIVSVFSRMDLLAVRECASYHWCLSHGLTQTALVPDAAFLENPTPYSIQEKHTFGVTGTAMSDRLNLDAFLESIQFASSLTGCLPRFYLSTKSDRAIADQWRKTFSQEPNVLSLRNPSEVVKHLAAERFLIGGRYHMAILASVAGIPFLLYPSNTHKNRGLLEILGLEQQLLQFAISRDDLTEITRKLLINEGTYRRNILARISMLREEIVRFSETLRCLTNDTETPDPDKIYKEFRLGPVCCNCIDLEHEQEDVIDVVGNPMVRPNLAKRIKLFFRRSRKKTSLGIQKYTIAR